MRPKRRLCSSRVNSRRNVPVAEPSFLRLVPSGGSRIQPWRDYALIIARFLGPLFFQFIAQWLSKHASTLCTVRYGLDLPVFFFELALHFEVHLTLALDTLLFHVANYTLVHSLYLQSVNGSIMFSSSPMPYGFIRYLLVMDEVDDANRTQDGTRKRCLCFR